MKTAIVYASTHHQIGGSVALVTSKSFKHLEQNILNIGD